MASFGGPPTGPSERKKTFKKGVDQEESRRRREETTIQIRKNKKEERLQKRRTAGPGFPPPADPSVPPVEFRRACRTYIYCRL